MESEPDSTIPLLDVLVIRKRPALTTKAYKKPSHTGCYLNFKSNHSPHVRREFIQRLHNTISTTCQEWQDLLNKTDNLRCTLQLSGSLTVFLISRVVAIWRRRWSLLAPHLSPLWNTFLKISNKYGTISTLWLPSTQNFVKTSFMRTRPVQNLQQTAHCTYSFLCVCGSSCQWNMQTTNCAAPWTQAHSQTVL